MSMSSSDANKLDFQQLLDRASTLIEHQLQEIPSDSPHSELPRLLEPVLRGMALTMGQSEAEFFLQNKIKERFKLKGMEVGSLAKDLKAYRKENEKEKKENKDPSMSDADILAAFKNDKGVEPLHPAQDYRDGVMHYAVKGSGNIYILTSAGKLFPIDKALEHGFALRYLFVDTARFSADGAVEFMEQKKTVMPSELYQKIHSYIERFIVFKEPAYKAFLTLWVMGTYVFMIFRYFPYLWFNAEKGSGKTLLMEILAAIAFNGELVLSPTAAVIFRDVSQNLPSLFIDEVEKFGKYDKDAQGAVISILNAGFNKSGVVKRVEGEDRVIKKYPCYSPKGLAGINSIDDVLNDRAIKVLLLKKRDDEFAERYKERLEIVGLQREIRDELYIFGLCNAKAIAQLYEQKDSEWSKSFPHLGNRELDLWEPILVLAKIVDDVSPEPCLLSTMKSLSQKVVAERQRSNVDQNETYKVLTVLKKMISDLQDIHTKRQGVKVFDAKKVLSFFKHSEEFDWITRTNSLTSRLKRIGVRSEQIRLKSEGSEKKVRVYIVDESEFKDLCERYKI